MFYTINLKKKRLLAAVIICLVGIVFTVWLISRVYPLSQAGLIMKYSKVYGLEPALVCAVIHAESRFKIDAFSRKGAGGLMQLTGPTAAWLAEEMGIEDFAYELVFQPEPNIRMGCYYLKRLLDKFNGDETLALAAYNAGEGNVGKWLKNPDYSADGITLDAIPFKETRDYIARVKRNTRVYEKLLYFIGGSNIGGGND